MDNWWGRVGKIKKTLDGYEISLHYNFNDTGETLDFREKLERQEIPFEEERELTTRIVKELRARAKKYSADADRLEEKVQVRVDVLV